MITIPAWPTTLIAVLTILLAAPAISHHGFRNAPAPSRNLPATEVYVGRALGWAGFAVYPDGSTLPSHVDAMSLSRFQKVMRRSSVETIYHALTARADLHPPFAVLIVSAVPRRATYLVAPVELLTRTDVALWRIRFEPLPGYKYKIWDRVVAITPQR